MEILPLAASLIGVGGRSRSFSQRELEKGFKTSASQLLRDKYIMLCDRKQVKNSLPIT